MGVLAGNGLIFSYILMNIRLDILHNYVLNNNKREHEFAKEGDCWLLHRKSLRPDLYYSGSGHLRKRFTRILRALPNAKPI